MKYAVSIIIPVFNAQDYIGQALKSVTRQTLKNIQIICVDDCSTDGSLSIIKKFQDKDSRITYCKMDKNSGSGPCRNMGIKKAEGDYIGFLDADDVLYNRGSLEQLYNAAINNKALVVGGNLLRFDNDAPGKARDWRKSVITEDRFYDYNEYQYSCGYSRFIYKRDFIVENNFEFPPFRRYQDPVWFVKVMVVANQYYGVAVDHYYYRNHHKFVSMTPDTAKDVFKGQAQILRIFEDHDLRDHYRRERRERDYYLYKLFYANIFHPQRWDQSIDLVKKYYSKDYDFYYGPRHFFGVIKYGLILLKNSFRTLKYKIPSLANYSKNEKRMHIVIARPSGGAKKTSSFIAEAAANSGIDVEIKMFFDQSLPKLQQTFYGFGAMVDWFIRQAPQKIFVIGMPMATIIILLKIIMFWRTVDVTVLCDTHISGHLKFRKQNKNSLIFQVVSSVTHNSFFYRQVLRHARHIITLNHSMADDVIMSYGADREKVHIIPSFADQTFFDAPLNENLNNQNIIFVGRLSQEKNLTDILEAFTIVKQIYPKLCLTIVGDGAERARLERKAREFSIHDQIDFIGETDDVSHYIKNAQCLVLTSHYEGFPLVIVEAMAMGVPVVAYDCPSGPKDTINDGENGYLVPHYDVKRLAKALCKAMDTRWDAGKIRESVSEYQAIKVREQYMNFMKMM